MGALFENKVFYSSLPPSIPGGKDKPENLYPDADVAKIQILLDNKNKSGIYLWRNRINGKKYVGSSKNLSVRFSNFLILII